MVDRTIEVLSQALKDGTADPQLIARALVAVQADFAAMRTATAAPVAEAAAEAAEPAATAEAEAVEEAPKDPAASLVAIAARAARAAAAAAAATAAAAAAPPVVAPVVSEGTPTEQLLVEIGSTPMIARTSTQNESGRGVARLGSVVKPTKEWSPGLVTPFPPKLMGVDVVRGYMIPTIETLVEIVLNGFFGKAAPGRVPTETKKGATFVTAAANYVERTYRRTIQVKAATLTADLETRVGAHYGEDVDARALIAAAFNKETRGRIINFVWENTHLPVFAQLFELTRDTTFDVLKEFSPAQGTEKHTKGLAKADDRVMFDLDAQLLTLGDGARRLICDMVWAIENSELVAAKAAGKGDLSRFDTLDTGFVKFALHVCLATRHFQKSAGLPTLAPGKFLDHPDEFKNTFDAAFDAPIPSPSSSAAAAAAAAAAGAGAVPGEPDLVMVDITQDLQTVQETAAYVHEAAGGDSSSSSDDSDGSNSDAISSSGSSVDSSDDSSSISSSDDGSSSSSDDGSSGSSSDSSSEAGETRDESTSADEAPDARSTTSMPMFPAALVVETKTEEAETVPAPAPAPVEAAPAPVRRRRTDFQAGKMSARDQELIAQRAAMRLRVSSGSSCEVSVPPPPPPPTSTPARTIMDVARDVAAAAAVTKEEAPAAAAAVAAASAAATAAAAEAAVAEWQATSAGFADAAGVTMVSDTEETVAAKCELVASGGALNKKRSIDTMEAQDEEEEEEKEEAAGTTAAAAAAAAVEEDPKQTKKQRRQTKKAAKRARKAEAASTLDKASEQARLALEAMTPEMRAAMQAMLNTSS